MSFQVPNEYRLRKTAMGTDDSAGNNGAFIVQVYSKFAQAPATLQIIASDGEGWEHVSVSIQGRCPTWAEMCHVKDLFWDPQDCVIQFHPPQSEYINCHPNCLHLWRPIGFDIRTPPSMLVGVKK